MNDSFVGARIGATAANSAVAERARRGNQRSALIQTIHRRNADEDGAEVRDVSNSDSIARGIAARDTKALGELYDLMGSRAFGLAFTVTGDSALAEDAVQDAFISLWRQAERVNAGRGRIESLLLTLVHRRAVDHVRKRSRADRLHSELQWDWSDGEPDDPEALALENHDRSEVIDALEALPGEQKTVVELAYFRGMTQREIADETRVSLGTVKGRMRLALGKLRSAFGLDGDLR